MASNVLLEFNQVHICTLIFKLKQQSITPQDLENLKNALQEYNSIECNLPNIRYILGGANYEISMVPQFFNEGSGGYYHLTDNSGFHAILEALNPSNIAVSEDDVDDRRLMDSMAQITTNRQIAVEILRQGITRISQDDNIKNMSNMLLGLADLTTDHLLAVATLLKNSERTIPPPDCSQDQRSELQKYDSALRTPRTLIVIDAAQNKYTCITSNLEVSETNIDASLTQMLQPMTPPPVVLLHRAGRWQACIPNPPAKSSCCLLL
ncbi:MAG: hypothetical protein LBH52_00010 [Puniceicoccales bacterium]|jgi:hypothetical protein|nr:hypothetical protein [Puniceicoccales bacterium]